MGIFFIRRENRRRRQIIFRRGMFSKSPAPGFRCRWAIGRWPGPGKLSLHGRQRHQTKNPAQPDHGPRQRPPRHHRPEARPLLGHLRRILAQAAAALRHRKSSRHDGRGTGSYPPPQRSSPFASRAQKLLPRLGQLARRTHKLLDFPSQVLQQCGIKRSESPSQSRG